MAELLIFTFMVVVLIMIAGFIIGFQLGRLKGMNDAIESKESAREYIESVIERVEQWPVQ